MISIAVTLLAKHFVTIDNWIGFLCKSTICVLVYISCIWFLAFNKDEKSLIIKSMKQIILWKHTS